MFTAWSEIKYLATKELLSLVLATKHIGTVSATKASGVLLKTMHSKKLFQAMFTLLDIVVMHKHNRVRLFL